MGQNPMNAAPRESTFPHVEIVKDQRVGSKVRRVVMYHGCQSVSYRQRRTRVLRFRSGSRVLWDLDGAYPGTYTITAGVDDGCGICGKTITKSVTIR